jgi:hypothetical protein
MVRSDPEVRRFRLARPEYSVLRACSRAPDGQDALGLGGIGFDLHAQPVDVGVDGMFVALVLIAPHGIEQVHPREHFAGMLREVIQQVEFTRRQLNGLAVDVASRVSGSIVRPAICRLPASMRESFAMASTRRSKL